MAVTHHPFGELLSFEAPGRWFPPRLIPCLLACGVLQVGALSCGLLELEPTLAVLALAASVPFVVATERLSRHPLLMPAQLAITAMALSLALKLSLVSLLLLAIGAVVLGLVAGLFVPYGRWFTLMPPLIDGRARLHVEVMPVPEVTPEAAALWLGDRLGGSWSVKPCIQRLDGRDGETIQDDDGPLLRRLTLIQGPLCSVAILYYGPRSRPELAAVHEEVVRSVKFHEGPSPAEARAGVR